jgi:hypothetical protein
MNVHASVDTRSVVGPAPRQMGAKILIRTHVMTTLCATMMDLVKSAVRAMMDTVETARLAPTRMDVPGTHASLV